ncbi:unnamed protein product [Linum trigynum]|uniref:Uncharacterized protein n=1 Tax=Linum trigynum TaxID=586398 RepID=A0AAV2E5L3_9ROSI
MTGVSYSVAGQHLATYGDLRKDRKYPLNRNAAFGLLLFIALAVILVPGAVNWSKEGHMITCRIAQRRRYTGCGDGALLKLVVINSQVMGPQSKESSSKEKVEAMEINISTSQLDFCFFTCPAACSKAGKGSLERHVAHTIWKGQLGCSLRTKIERSEPRGHYGLWREAG